MRQAIKFNPVFIRILLITIGIGLAVAFTIVMRPRVTLPSIDQLHCTSAKDTPCPDQVVSALQPLMGQPLLFSALETKANQLLLPVGYSVLLYTRVLPETLQLQVAPLDVLFTISLKDKTHAITSTGSVIDTDIISDQRIVHMTILDATTAAQLETTQTAPSWLVQSVKDLNEFFTSTNRRPSVLELRSPFALFLKLEDYSQPIVINPQESALNCVRLSTILKSDQSFLQASPSGILDVRFRLPVLRS